MKKTIMLLIILLFSTNIYAISQDPYCYAASDFMVATYNDYAPELIALYDDTNVYFDINNDGIWDYKKRIDAYEMYTANLNWKLKDGSYIHSDKPVVYNQLLNDHYASVNRQCMPPISSLGNEIVLYPSGRDYANKWKIISPNAELTLFNPSNEMSKRSTNISTYISNMPDDNTKNIWYINSTKPIFALSPYTFSAKLDKDFITSMGGLTTIVSPKADTQIKFDNNGDGIFDEEDALERGFKVYSLNPGTRIISNKKIGVFEKSDDKTLDLSQASPTKSTNDELFVALYDNTKTYVTGLFNNDGGFEDTNFMIKDEINQEHLAVGSNNMTRIPTTMKSDAGRIKASKPVISYYNDFQNRKYRTFLRPMQTIEPYITSFSRKKFIGVNDTAIINVRAINPTSYDLEDVKITIRFLDDFSDSNIKYYILTRDLHDDNIVEEQEQKSVTSIDYGHVREFVINIDGIDAGEYVNIDYYLSTPEVLGTFVFPSASMEYDSEIWNYD